MAADPPLWRFLMTDLNLVTMSFLERLASDRSVAYVLNKGCVQSGVVPSDNPEVNIVHTDGFPFLSPMNRLLFGFRREEVGTTWVCRASGIIMQVEDSVQTDQPYSRYTAYDPWQLLYQLPCLLDDGTLPGTAGMSALPAERADEFALRLLTNYFNYADGLGDPHPEAYIDTVSGTFETTDVIYPFTLQQGQSIGEAWDQIVATGLCDIVLTPIYDPVVRPGLIAELSIYTLAGTATGLTLAWDDLPYSLVGVDRLIDGTQQANTIQFYKGQGGAPVTQQIDPSSVATYGELWAQQFFPSQVEQVGVENYALSQLLGRALPTSRLVETVTVLPTPGVAYEPLTDYVLGDTITIVASAALREELNSTLRVYAIPIDISDDALERVSNLLVSASPA